MKTANAAWFPLASIAALALVPVLAYAAFGYAGHDFDFHVSSWLELHNSWRAGHLAPGWASLANYRLGDPHLGMYPPVSLIAGGLLALLLPLRLAPAAFVWIALTLSGLSMYYACRRFVEQQTRLIAAALYMLSPYLVMTALVRYAAGELLVQAWLPLILLWFYATVWRKDKRALLLLGSLLGLSWLTNIPESIVMLYALTIVACAIAVAQRSLVPLTRVLLAETLGAALAAFYLAPLWRERFWINHQDLYLTRPTRYLLFSHYQAGGVEILKVFKYSVWIVVCAGTLLIAAGLWKRTEPWRRDPAATTWLFFSAVALFFQLPISLVLWQHLPQMRAVQLPFRFLPFIGVTIPFVLLAPATMSSLRRPAYVLIALLTLLPLFEHYRTQTTRSRREPPVTVQAQRWQNEGYSGMAEYIPAGETRPTSPQHFAPAAPANPQPGQTCDLSPSPAVPGELSFISAANAPCKVRLAVYFYPYWQAVDESGVSLPTSSDAQGLLIVSAPAGVHGVHVVFRPHSRLRVASAVVSLAMLLVTGLAFAWVRSGESNTSRLKREIDQGLAAAKIVPGLS